MAGRERFKSIAQRFLFWEYLVYCSLILRFDSAILLEPIIEIVLENTLYQQFAPQSCFGAVAYKVYVQTVMSQNCHVTICKIVLYGAHDFYL